MTGTIFDVEAFALNDGVGICTTVFGSEVQTKGNFMSVAGSFWNRAASARSSTTELNF